MIQSIKCPNCRAAIDSDPANPVVECPYCNLKNKNPLHKAKPTPAAVHIHTNAGKGGAKLGGCLAILIILPIVLGVGISIYVHMVASQATQTIATATGTQPLNILKQTGITGPGYRWYLNAPHIADANGDGVEDMVGKVYDGKVENLAVVNGRDFKLLWKGAALPKDNVIYLLGGQIVVSASNTLYGYRLDTGHPTWVAGLSDKVEKISLQGGSLWVLTKDEAWSSVALISGAVTPLAGAQDPRYFLPHTRDRAHQLIPSDPTLDLSSKQWPGLRVKRAFCPPELKTKQGSSQKKTRRRFSRNAYCDAPNGLAYAVQEKGSAIPFLVGYEPKTKKMRWSRKLVPEGIIEELESGFNAPNAAIWNDKAVVVYKRRDKPITMELISIADGRVYWSVPLTILKSHSHLSSVILGGSRVYVTGVFTELYVYNIQDGKLITKVGK